MEVHHHPDVHHKKKNFKEYFLEFLMLFLAVTMGFFAENIREHFAEQKTIHQNLSNYRQELLRNQKNIAIDKEAIKNQLPVLDSFVTIFNTEAENKDLRLTGRLFNQCIYDYNPNLETAAYQQMVNSGGLKLIDNDSLKNYLARYFDKIEEFKIFNQKLSSVIFNRFPDVAKHMDIYNLLKEKYNELKPFPNLTLEDRREIIILFMNQYEELLNANDALNDIDALNSKLLHIINE